MGDGTEKCERVGAWALLGIAALLPGCGGERGDGGSGGRADGSAAGGEVRRIEAGTGAWAGRARLEMVRDIPGRGELAGPEDPGPVLSRVRDLASDGERIVVLDGAAARVAVLDSSGHLEGYVGRRGGGPGEFRTPGRVEAEGGGVLVFERRPAVVHRWDGHGGFVGRSPPLSAGDPGPGVGTGPSTEAGTPVPAIADWGPLLPEGRAVRLVTLDPSDPSESRSAVHLADATGRLSAGAILSWTTPGTPSRLPEVFGARRSWTAGTGPEGTGRIVVARGDRYEIGVHDVHGRRELTIVRDVEPVPVTEDLRGRALSRFVEEARRAGAPPSVARHLEERVPVAETLPVIGGLWHSVPDRRLWVGVPGPGRSSGPPSVIRAYDVYEATGRYLGRVPAPRGFRLYRVRGARLYGARRDSLDVPGVRVYRLVEPG